MAGYSTPLGAPPRLAPLVPPQAEHAQQDELPTESVPPAPIAPMPEATYTAPPTTPAIPSAAPSTSEAFITISATEFRAMVHTFQTPTTTHNALFREMAAMRAQQDQHIVILCQIQQHLGLLPPPQSNILGPSKPIAPIEETIPA